MDIEKKINMVTLFSVIGIVISFFCANLYSLVLFYQLFIFLACKFPKRGSYGELPRYYPKESCCKPNLGKQLFFYMDVRYGLPKEEIWKTWFQIIWSLIFVIGNWSYVLLYTVTDDYIEWIFLIGALGCVCVGVCFDTVIKRKCFLNRYKKFTFDNFFYFFGIIKNIPPIIECEECVVVGVRTRKKNLVDVKTVLTGIIYQNVFVEDKYIDREFSIYQLYEICGLKYIVPQHLSETIKRDSSDWFVDRNGNQIWP